MVRNAANDDLHRSALHKYLAAIREPSSNWNLFNLSLHVAAVRTPRLDFRHSWEQLKLIQEHLAADAGAEPFEIIERINRVLFDEFNFSGNEEDYYNPDNSFMDRVLELRKGIPITLAVLYRELAQGIGLEVNGVAFPGHFLLSFESRGNRLFVDVFGKGTLLVESDCRELIEDIYDGKVQFESTMLDPVQPEQVVLRMLANLKQIYRKRGNSTLLLRILDRRVPLLDDPLPEILERGIVHLDLHHYRYALSDFEHFVDTTTDERMRDLIRSQIDKLKILAAGM